ncbi:hypothetical protein BC939DRAFT_499829 [Gamsiella multidivaricata]|uniref:uncharacterized protein n=1 Tax=Gamsiella multidivaricata TaxID=101098 RepID=UPI00221ECDCF|nr:uncharacterized protein BC939DRAFT_499829 [Gamsiella multidivaricata]KAI7829703.1 hypothetical protein BC939DRAFT_499829 [Gamsiella multidivaricata]
MTFVGMDRIQYGGRQTISLLKIQPYYNSIVGWETIFQIIEIHLDVVNQLQHVESNYFARADHCVRLIQ